MIDSTRTNNFPALHWAGLCAAAGISHAVIAPGSRSAQLSIAFARTKGLYCEVIADERVAGFTALGYAEALSKPVVLVCTSGSALLNLAPAVSEAFFRNIPLLVLSADRPPELIGQQDGQTIFQENAFGKHVKAFYQLPTRCSEPDEFEHSVRIFQEALLLLKEAPKAPVHINCPFREPFYPPVQSVQSAELLPWCVLNQRHLFKDNLKMLFSQALKDTDERILIVAGQETPLRDGIREKLQALMPLHVPVIADVISNYGFLKQSIQHQDVILSSPALDKVFLPDMLITFGQSVISKNLKLFLRNAPIKTHWHIQESGLVADTFKSLTHIVRLPLADFLAEITHFKGNKSYFENWQRAERTVADFHQVAFLQEWTEFAVIARVMEQLPNGSCLHLANSMAVRYANFLGLGAEQKQIKVYANRGTSGIDGCLSTAIGHAKATPDRLHLLLIGDTAFFYDQNAFWQNNLPKNLRILLNNNQGGGIFAFLPDARKQPELQDFFVAPHQLNAANLSVSYNIKYLSAKNFEELDAALPVFFAQELSILECFSDAAKNLDFFVRYKANVANKIIAIS